MDMGMIRPVRHNNRAIANASNCDSQPKGTGSALNTGDKSSKIRANNIFSE
jgi:hypothetical protein